TNGGEADTYITFARTSEEKGSKGVSAFIVEKDTPGLVIGANEKKMGLHGSPTVELSFDQCRVPATQLLGEEGQGFKIAMRSEEHTSELQSRFDLVCRLLLEKKRNSYISTSNIKIII